MTCEGLVLGRLPCLRRVDGDRTFCRDCSLTTVLAQSPYHYRSDPPEATALERMSIMRPQNGIAWATVLAQAARRRHHRVLARLLDGHETSYGDLSELVQPAYEVLLERGDLGGAVVLRAHGPRPNRVLYLTKPESLAWYLEHVADACRDVLPESYYHTLTTVPRGWIMYHRVLRRLIEDWRTVPDPIWCDALSHILLPRIEGRPVRVLQTPPALAAEVNRRRRTIRAGLAVRLPPDLVGYVLAAV